MKNMNAKNLRNFLLGIDNENMTISELRAELFKFDDQNETLTERDAESINENTSKIYKNGRI